jgi:Leucine-rich repeat (LRR) protein
MGSGFSLSLQIECLTEGVVKNCINALRSNDLEKVDLNGCNINMNSSRYGPQGVFLITRLMAMNDTLTNLNISRCGLTVQEACLFAESIECCPKLCELDISGNKLTDENPNYSFFKEPEEIGNVHTGIARLAQAIRSHGKLTKLNFSDCQLLGRSGNVFKGIIALGDGIAASKSLKWVKVCEIELSIPDLKGETAKDKLDLSNLNLGVPDTIVIAKCLESNKCCIRVTFADNPACLTKSDSAVVLSECLQKNEALAALDLSRTGIDNVGAGQIADLLANNYVLEDVDLRSNLLSPFIGDAIFASRPINSLKSISGIPLASILAGKVISLDFSHIGVGEDPAHHIEIEEVDEGLMNKLRDPKVVAFRYTASEGSNTYLQLPSVKSALPSSGWSTSAITEDGCYVGDRRRRLSLCDAHYLALVLASSVAPIPKPLVHRASVLELHSRPASSEYKQIDPFGSPAVATARAAATAAKTAWVASAAASVAKLKAANALSVSAAATSAGLKRVQVVVITSCFLPVNALQGLTSPQGDIAKSLDFSNRHLWPEDAVMIAAMMRNNSNLTELDLSHNDLVDYDLQRKEYVFDGIAALTSGLKANHNLKMLNLANVRLCGKGLTAHGTHHEQHDCTGVQMIGDAIVDPKSRCKLEFLNIAGNHLGDEGKNALADVLGGCRTHLACIQSDGWEVTPMTKNLQVSSKRLGSADTTLLCAVLMNNHTCISFDLSDNLISDKGAAGVSALASVLKINTTLQRLVLAKNHLGKEGLALVLEAMQENETLLALDLSQTGFGLDSTGYITEMLLNNNSLRHLLLRGNCLLRKGADALASCLHINRSLNYLDLSDTGMDIGCCKLLAETLLDNSSLAKIILNKHELPVQELKGASGKRGFFFSQKGLQVQDLVFIAGLLKVNKCVRTLDLSLNNVGGWNYQEGFASKTDSNGVLALRDAMDGADLRLTQVNLRSNRLDNEARTILGHYESLKTVYLGEAEFADETVPGLEKK